MGDPPEGLQCWQQNALWKSDPGLSQSLLGLAHGGAQMTAQQRKPTPSCYSYLPRPATVQTTQPPCQGMQAEDAESVAQIVRRRPTLTSRLISEFVQHAGA